MRALEPRRPAGNTVDRLRAWAREKGISRKAIDLVIDFRRHFLRELSDEQSQEMAITLNLALDGAYQRGRTAVEREHEKHQAPDDCACFDKGCEYGRNAGP
jgi:hypothetical protein